MPVSCRFSQEHPNQVCLCSVCHLSSELFPRRQDGKIVLPGLPASREFQTATAHCDAQDPSQLPVFPYLLGITQPTASIATERCKRRHVQSNTSTVGSGTSFGRFENAGAGIDGPSGIPECPMGSSTYNYSLDDRKRVSASESTLSTSSKPASNLVKKNATTPTFKFCPPFVASDRIALPASSDAAKEGVTMIPWSARRRKQKYHSGFDSGTGQGKSKTMFRYYGFDSCSTHDSDITR